MPQTLPDRLQPRPTPITRATRSLWRLAAGAACCLPALAPAQVFNWATGTYTPGVTGPATLLAGQTLNINNGGFKYFDTVSGTFTVQGTVNWNADSLYLQGSAALVNQGLWQSWADTSLAWNGGTPTFLNTGTFRKAGGTGATTVQSALGFVNSGTIEAASGRIDFLGGTRFEAGSVFAAGGDVRLTTGSHVFAGNYSSGGSLLLASGTFVGEAAVASGSTRWTGGFVQGSFRNAAGAEWLIGSGGFKYVDGAGTLFTNDGTVRWSSDPVYLQNGSQVLNRGSWLAEGDQSLFWNGGTGVGFVNEGLFHKTAGTGSSTVQTGVGFVNRGTVRADSGSLVFAGGARFDNGSLFSGTGQVRLAGNNTLAGVQDSVNLVLASGTHGGDAAELRGSTRFEGGSLQGGWTLAAGHTLAGRDGGFKYLSGAATEFVNRGTVSWDTANPLYLETGGRFVNEGLFIATADTQLANNGGAPPVFRNAASGTVRAAAGQQLIVGLNLMVNDGGLIEAEVGGSVLFNAGARFNDGSRFAGAGLVRVTAGATFAGAQASSNLQLEGGSFAGSGAQLAGTAVLSGGRFTDGWTIAPGATLRGVNGGFKYLSGDTTTLTNRGTVSWETANPWYLESGARFVNEGLFRATTGTLLADNGGADPLLELRGSGRIEAAAGTVLTVGVPLASTGILHAEAGAEIRYLGRARFDGGTRFSGSGLNVADGNNEFAGSLQVANLELRNGLHTGDAAQLQGSTRFSGGRLTGSWTLGASHALVVSAGAFKYIGGTSTVVLNDGLLSFASGQPLYLENGGTLSNRGTLELASGAALFDNGGATPTLRNEGLLIKADGAGTAVIGNGIAFTNLGTVDVRAGTLSLPASWTNEGRLTGSGTLSLAGTLTNLGTVAPGSSPGTLGVSGALLLAGAGTLEAELGTLASHDLLLVSGTVQLGGTLALSCWDSCSFAVGDVITLIDSSGDLSGSFASITLSGFATGAFEPIYDTVADRFQLRVTETVSAVPEPHGLGLMLGGLLTMGWLRRRRA